MVDADHISRQTNLPEATPSERLETQEFDPTYPLPHPLDQWQHLVSHDLKDGPYHPLEQVYEPRQVVYLDLLGPISGTGSESRFVITALDRFSRYLSVAR